MEQYKDIIVSEEEAKDIAKKIFDKEGSTQPLNGEIDFNFRLTTLDKKYILKVSRPDANEEYINFQIDLLNHLNTKNLPDLIVPEQFCDQNNNALFRYTDQTGKLRFVRLLSWIEGELFSSSSSKDYNFLLSLGKTAGKITQCLIDFSHGYANRPFDWDIANALWVKDYLHLFEHKKYTILSNFIDQFEHNKSTYDLLPRSVIHNDANDNNVIIKSETIEKTVVAIIDYGDAIYTQTINDLAVTCAYAIMNCVDPLSSACAIVSGYQSVYPFSEKEYVYLYNLIAMRLVISVTKSAINKSKEADNEYLQISDQAAWDLLEKWNDVSPNFAWYRFRDAAGFSASPLEKKFNSYALTQSLTVHDLLDVSKDLIIEKLDLSVDSKVLAHFSNYIDSEQYGEKISKRVNQGYLLVGGYGEARPIYTTDAFKLTNNEGQEHRTMHLGLDFWTNSGTPVRSFESGEVVSVHDNDNNKDYGPTVIIKHEVLDFAFYALYGHLSKSTLSLLKSGDKISKGDVIGYLGMQSENGNWVPHLHFQIILDMLDCSHDFYGVSLPSLWSVFQSICPDPNLLFKLDVLTKQATQTIVEDRKKHLGRSLSVSYKTPLHIVRGQMQYLIDHQGQKYIDTVNNVAHVGHEHPDVINAGIIQMQLLNTNTRYLHEEITTYAKELLATFPKQLSVIHFVNSGSEANELALRMARARTNQRDIVAIELGYHGNTQGCIDISSYKFNGKGGRGKPDFTHLVPLPDSFRGIYRGEHCGTQYACHIDNIISELRTLGRSPAAFIAESIVSCGGQIPLPNGFLRDAYHKIRSVGGVCIADEVQVGFGRVGKSFWAFELHDVEPDIVTLGKPIGNGHPLGAVVCTEEVANAFANGMEYFNTFGGNPVSCAIGKEVLAVIKRDQLQENALTIGSYLKKELISLSRRFPFLADVRGEGLFLGVEFVDEHKFPLTALTGAIANKMKDYKVLMSVDGPFNNVLKIKPPMCFNFSNADYMLTGIERLLKEY